MNVWLMVKVLALALLIGAGGTLAAPQRAEARAACGPNQIRWLLTGACVPRKCGYYQRRALTGSGRCVNRWFSRR